MASTYSNTGIELIADGEQSGTWGQTTNTNWQLIEELASGVVSIALTGTTYTLTTTDGATSNGRHAVVKFTGSPGGTCTVTVSPSDMQKVYFIVNSSDQTVTLTQGSGGNVSVSAGKTKVVYCDGAGGTAAVVDISGGFDSTTLAELGVTASAAELNIMDGVTATTAEINILDGVTATAAELNILDGVTATTAELNHVDGVTSNIQTQIDGISTELVNDTTPQLGGNLDANGKNIVFGDSSASTDDRLVFGAGSDLQIYHNGSHSVIEENTASSDLQIKGSNIGLYSSDDQQYISCVVDNAVSLYYDDAVKLATTGAGITVTGSVTADNVGIVQGSNKSATGTSVSWSIPSGVKRVSLQAWDVSMNGSNYPKVRLGTSSGVVSSGYRGRAVVNCGAGGTNSVDISDAVPLLMGGGSGFYLVGNYTMTRVGTTNNWIIDGVHLFNCAGFSTGRINLPAELDRIEIVLSGSDSFDAGSFGISWEY